MDGPPPRCLIRCRLSAVRRDSRTPTTLDTAMSAVQRRADRPHRRRSRRRTRASNIDVTPFRPDRFRDGTAVRLPPRLRRVRSRAKLGVRRGGTSMTSTAFADSTIASNTATPCSSSPPGTARERPAESASAKLFQFGAFGTGLWKCNELRPLVCVQMFRIDQARAHLPGREVLDVADFDPAFRPNTCMRHVSAVAMMVPR